MLKSAMGEDAKKLAFRFMGIIMAAGAIRSRILYYFNGYYSCDFIHMSILLKMRNILRFFSAIMKI